MYSPDLEQTQRPVGVNPELLQLLQTIINMAEEQMPMAPAPQPKRAVQALPLHPHGAEETVLDLCHAGTRYTLTRIPLATATQLALSPREQEIVQCVAHGDSDREIGVRLGISHWTVGTHLRRIYAKLGVNSRAEMVAALFCARSPYP